MDQKDARRTAHFSLANQAPVKTYPIGGANTDAENCWLAVYRNAARADPVLHLTTRSDTGAGKYLLKAFAFLATFAYPTPLCRSLATLLVGFVTVAQLLGAGPRLLGAFIELPARHTPLFRR
jgi:hypothetical protein